MRSGQTQVVITSYNKALTIASTIESIAKSTEKPARIVLVDDGSSDETVGIAQAAAQKWDLHLKAVELLRDGDYQLSRSRNVGVEACDEGLVVILDGDVLVGERFLECHRVAQGRPGRWITGGPLFEFLCGTYGPIAPIWHTDARAWAYHNTFSDICGSNLGLQRSSWEEVDGFDTSYDGYYGLEETDLCYRLAQIGYVPWCDPDASVIHCPHLAHFQEHKRDMSRNLALFREKHGLDLAALFVERANEIQADLDQRLYKVGVLGSTYKDSNQSLFYGSTDWPMVGQNLASPSFLARQMFRYARGFAREMVRETLRRTPVIGPWLLSVRRKILARKTR